MLAAPAFVGGIIDVAQHDDFAESLIEEYGAEFAQNYFRSLEILPLLFDSFAVSRMGETIYPADFGGVYINDYGSITILTVESQSVGILALDGFAASRDDAVITREVNFSYSYLRETMGALDYLIQSKFESHIAAYNAAAWHLDVINNRLLVELLDFSAEMIDLFRTTIFDSPVLYFAESSGRVVIPPYYFADYHFPYDDLYSSAEGGFVEIAPLVQNITISPGEPIYLRRGGATGSAASLGFRAYQGSWSAGTQQTDGFVVAAHMGMGASAPLTHGDRLYVNSSGTFRYIGTVWDYRLQGLDAAFVRRCPTVALNNRAGTHSFSDHILTTPVVGLRVYSGGRVSGVRGGRITNSLSSVTISNPSSARTIVVTHAATADYPSVEGDSGGIAFVPGTAVNSGIVGITIGRSDTRSFISRADEINRVLRIRLP